MATTGQLRDGIAGLAPDAKDVGAALLKASLRARLLDEAPTVTLGRYEVVRRLGVGGMGVVYEGRDPEFAAHHYAAATKRFEAAPRIFEQEPDHSNLIPILVHLGESLQQQGRGAEARPHTERALALMGDETHTLEPRARAVLAEASG